MCCFSSLGHLTSVIGAGVPVFSASSLFDIFLFRALFPTNEQALRFCESRLLTGGWLLASWPP